MNRDYITYSIDEFFLLGKKDALSDSIELTDEIIRALSSIPMMNKNEISIRIRKYLIGYKIGILESNFKRVNSSTYFDVKYKTFKYYDKNGTLKEIPFIIGYNSLEEESYHESSKLIKNLRS